MSHEWSFGKLLGKGANGEAYLAYRLDYITQQVLPHHMWQSWVQTLFSRRPTYDWNMFTARQDRDVWLKYVYSPTRQRRMSSKRCQWARSQCWASLPSSVRRNCWPWFDTPTLWHTVVEMRVTYVFIDFFAYEIISWIFGECLSRGLLHWRRHSLCHNGICGGWHYGKVLRPRHARGSARTAVWYVRAGIFNVV